MTKKGFNQTATELNIQLEGLICIDWSVNRIIYNTDI